MSHMIRTGRQLILKLINKRISFGTQPSKEDKAQAAVALVEWGKFESEYITPLKKAVTFEIEYVNARENEGEKDELLRSLMQLPSALLVHFHPPFKTATERTYKRRHEYPQLINRHIQPKIQPPQMRPMQSTRHGQKRPTGTIPPGSALKRTRKSTSREGRSLPPGKKGT